MGFFRAAKDAFRANTKPAAGVVLEETFGCTVVGTDYHVGSHLPSGTYTAELRREPRNQHDPNAILVSVNRRSVGYIPRETAARFAPMMDAAQHAVLRSTLQVSPEGSFAIRMPLPTNPVFGVQAEPKALVKPPGPTRRPWGRLVRDVEVEDEYLHREALVAVMRLLGQHPSPLGVEARDIDTLLITPSRGTRVAVVIEGQVVGYLSEADERDYRPALVALDKTRVTLQVTSRIWVIEEDIPRGRVILNMPSPSEVLPPATLPSTPHVVLPSGSKVQVTGEENHLDTLVDLLQNRSAVPVATTLHSHVKATGRSQKTVVQVRCAGRPIGELTPAMSAHFLPLIAACGGQGVDLVARATVQGNRLKADVVLDATKAGDLPHEWIERHIDAPRIR